MPGLLRDPPRDPPAGKDPASPAPSSRKDKAAAELEECVEVQEWLVERYRFLRRELEDVDREITRLRRRMEAQAKRREEYMKSLNEDA